MLKLLILNIFLSSWGVTPPIHEFHVSKCLVEFNEPEQASANEHAHLSG
jgi:hypothetical protein